MYTALYRAYRPEVFEEILGQEHIVRILKNQIATNSTSHAYLFCGTRGTGKTTTARLLAKGLNCLSDGEKPCGQCEACKAIRDGNFIDVIEIDAASNNGVDNIRELRESVNYPPAVGRKKVYIIDEVHMLSNEAFNALLKTLEEPPEYVLFILATTEVQKLPATILSRCMRLDFKRVPESTLVKGMSEICEKKGIKVTEDALRLIASNADGSVRDGLSILDQCISGGDDLVDTKEVLEFLGASGEEVFVNLTTMVSKMRTAEAIEYVASVLNDGKDVRQFMRDWINHYRNLLMTKFIRNPQDILNMSVENIDRVRQQSAVMELEEINRGIMELSKALNEAKWSTQPRILLELSIVRLCMGAGEIRAMQTQLDKTFIQRRNVPATPSELVTPTVEAIDNKTSQGENHKSQITETNPDEEIPWESIDWSDEGYNEPSNKNLEESYVAAKDSEAVAQDAVSETSMDRMSDDARQFDCEAIWDAVFNEGEARKGSFFLIRTNSRLESIGEASFTVVPVNDITRSMLERDRDLIETLVEKHTGSKRVMRIGNVNSTNTVSNERTEDDIVKEAQQLLGAEVIIE